MLSGLVNMAFGSGPNGSNQEKRELLTNPDVLIPKNVVVIFPSWLERALARFDDPIIHFLQHYISGKTYILAEGLGHLCRIWYGVAVPLLFYLLGYDELSKLWLCYLLVLWLVIQMTKRFIWRHRPFAVSRARAITLSVSSSFPSQRVTFTIMNIYLIYRTIDILYGQVDGEGLETATFVLFWVVSSFFIVLVICTKIMKGVHYPSDCAASFVTSLLVWWLGGWLFNAVNNYCQSTLAADDDYASPRLLDAAVIKGYLLGIVIIPIISIKKFLGWSKFYRIANLTLPPLVCLATYSCSSEGTSHPPFAERSILNIVYALVTTIVLLYICWIKQFHPKRWWTRSLHFCIVYPLCMYSIVQWRGPQGPTD